MKHVYNEFVNFTESYAVHFHIYGPSNLTEMVSVIDMEGMVSCTHLRYTQDYLMWGICSLIKPATMKKFK